MVRIRALRDTYGLTAEQLADRMAELGVPVDRNTLYNLELGAKKPSDRILDAYARALGVNPLDVWQGPLRPPARADASQRRLGARRRRAVTPPVGITARMLRYRRRSSGDEDH
ncbi:MAG TPA: helix-turn-helix transcriptional regulator [Pseudonocardiaceae bacterium]|jgi:transcriptional regulator with XRE-family HTH domain|nr:helix-turn-helix transcriptional regulator [Pseudonocardiaceae bacterium]